MNTMPPLTLRPVVVISFRFNQGDVLVTMRAGHIPAECVRRKLNVPLTKETGNFQILRPEELDAFHAGRTRYLVSSITSLMTEMLPTVRTGDL